MTTTRLYLSTDSGAPVLNGTAGSLVSLLEVCLVGTAGVAYGSTLAAGWSRPYANTSTKAVFRNSVAAGGTGCYVRILDDGSTTGPPLGAANQEAYYRAYLTMSDLDTGTEATAQSLIRKSSAASSTARAWILVADERTFYLTIQATTSSFAVSSAQDGVYWGGDFESFIPGDAYAYGTGGRSVSTTNAAGGILFGSSSTPTAAMLSLPRAYTLASGAVSACVFSTTSTVSGTSAMMATPSPGSGLEFYDEARIIEAGVLRGRLRGAFTSLNNLSTLTTGTVRAAVPGMPIGSELIICAGGANASTANRGAMAIEKALAW